MFHKTQHNIYVPDYDKLLKNITNHCNGALGLWFANENKDWASGFGGNTYEFGIKNRKSVDMPLSLLSSMASKFSHADYVSLHHNLLDDGYTDIRLIENCGWCDMGVVLDFNSIANWTYLK